MVEKNRGQISVPIVLFVLQTFVLSGCVRETASTNGNERSLVQAGSLPHSQSAMPDSGARRDSQRNLNDFNEPDLAASKLNSLRTWRLIEASSPWFAPMVRFDEQPDGSAVFTRKNYTVSYARTASTRIEALSRMDCMKVVTPACASIAKAVPKIEYVTSSGHISKSDVEKLAASFQAASVCSPPPDLPPDLGDDVEIVRSDGEDWLFEEAGQGRYCAAVRWSPGNGPFKTLADLMFSLAGGMGY